MFTVNIEDLLEVLKFLNDNIWFSIILMFFIIAVLLILTGTIKVIVGCISSNIIKKLEIKNISTTNRDVLTRKKRNKSLKWFKDTKDITTDNSNSYYKVYDYFYFVNLISC